MSNVFVSLFVPEHAGQGQQPERVDRAEPRLEADLIAFKYAKTDLARLGVNLDCPPPLGHEPHNGEFFAGQEGNERLVYCEVRAYLQSAGDGFADYFKEGANILDKIEQIRQRFHEALEVLLIGHGIGKGSINTIREKRTWWYKELTDVFWFVAERFQQHGEKLGVVYNDPCLEVMRGFFGPHPLATLGRAKP
jgi:hypothetical protein